MYGLLKTHLITHPISVPIAKILDYYKSDQSEFLCPIWIYLAWNKFSWSFSWQKIFLQSHQVKGYISSQCWCLRWKSTDCDILFSRRWFEQDFNFTFLTYFLRAILAMIVHVIHHMLLFNFPLFLLFFQQRVQRTLDKRFHLSLFRILLWKLAALPKNWSFIKGRQHQNLQIWQY